MPEIVLRNALVDMGAGDFRRADVVVADGRIAQVGEAGDRRNAEVVDCANRAVVPGIVNAHNHSNENWWRGRWDNLPLELWMLFSYPALANPPQTPREIYVRTLLGGLEMIRSGATCVVDYVYELAGWTDESIDAVAKAYRDIGLRALIVIGMSDRSFTETVVMDLGLVPPDLLGRLEADKPPSWAEWEAYTRKAYERLHRPDEGISIGLGPSGPQRCTDEMLAGCAALSAELDLAVHIHVLETRMQALSGMKMYGHTLPEHLRRLGFLSPRVSFEHGIWMTDRDIDITAEAGVTVVHNPASNMKLGSGVCAVPRLLDGGVNVALGCDGTTSNDGNDMYATMKLAALVHKLWDIDYHEWRGAKEAWQMATAGGAPAAGDPDGLGRIEPGRRADLVLLDLENAIFTPLNNPLNQLVLCSARQAIVSSMVGGRFVLRDGAITGIDEPAILAEARELGKAVTERHREAFAIGDLLVESVRAGWLEALRTDVGVNRSIPLERR